MATRGKGLTRHGFRLGPCEVKDSRRVGALLNSQGHAVGIISMREGGISLGLHELSAYINRTSSHGSVQIMGVDPLQATKAIIQTLDQFISTGIGYARSIRFSREWLSKNQGLLK
ncbi:MAG: hypothetical protein HY848_19375 [Betaproteobacteria bacterium]|nr:hypothetical protein [Betaproteobacteria bacterium]